MKALLLLAFVSCSVSAQVREGETQDRNEGRRLLIEIYRRPDVTEACRKDPYDLITVIHQGREFTVNCKTRREYLDLFDNMPE